jgi:hypothetical protein
MQKWVEDVKMVTKIRSRFPRCSFLALFKNTSGRIAGRWPILHTVSRIV